MGIRRQRRGAFEEGGGRGESASRSRTLGRAFELARDVLVRCDGRVRAVPGSPIGIGVRVRSRCQRAMGCPPLVGSSRRVDRRTKERVSKGDARAQRNQVDRLCGRSRLGREPQLARSTPEERRVAERLGRTQQQQSLGLLGKLLYTAAEACLDAAFDRRRVWHGEPARQARRRERAWELEQGERVPACLRDDPRAHLFVEYAETCRGEKFAGVVVGQSLQPQVRQAGQLSRAIRVALREEHQHALGLQTACDERQDLSRGAVEPLRVVDEAHQRLRLGGV